MKIKFIILLACFAVAVSGCSEQQSNASQDSGAAGGMPPTPVVAFKAIRAPIEDTLSLVGNLAANEAVDITTEIDGIIKLINFKEGETVRAGQLLIQLDEGKLKAELEQTEAQLTLAESTLDRFRALSSIGGVSRQEVDQATAEYNAAQALVNLRKEGLSDAFIKAPFDGVMGERLFSPGQFIERGSKLTTLINQNPMKAEFRVPERFIAELITGQRIELTVVAYANESFTGEVYFIDPQIDETTRTVLVKARVPNEEGKLRRGMFANLKLIVTVRENAILIPETALMWSADEATIFVIDENQTVQVRSVKPGIRQASVVEISEGISAGEIIVTEGIQKIGPGASVSVRFEEDSPQALTAID